MWLTQSYLGNAEPDAKVFIYYFFQNYNQEQEEFTRRVQHELENLGEAYRDRISLLMPNPRYAHGIESEIRQSGDFYELFEGQLPGLFISPKPLKQIDKANDDCVYLPFTGMGAEDVAATITKMRGLVDSKLLSGHPVGKKAFGAKLYDALELKPGIFGFRIDLKKLKDW